MVEGEAQGDVDDQNPSDGHHHKLISSINSRDYFRNSQARMLMSTLVFWRRSPLALNSHCRAINEAIITLKPIKGVTCSASRRGRIREDEQQR